MKKNLTFLLSVSQVRLFIPHGEALSQDNQIVAYLQEHSFIPFTLLIDTPNHQWFRLSLSGLKFWDRAFVSRQVEQSELGNNTVRGTYFLGKDQRLFVGLELTDFQNKWIETLSQLCHPISQIKAWVPEIVRLIQAATPPPTRWHLIQATTSEGEKILIFCEGKAILLVRPFDEKRLEDLIYSSFTYLQRQGYKGDPFTYCYDGDAILPLQASGNLKVTINSGLKDLCKSLVRFSQNQPSKVSLTVKMLKNQRRLHTIPRITVILVGLTSFGMSGIVLEQLYGIYADKQQFKSLTRERQKLEQIVPSVEGKSLQTRGFQSFLTLVQKRNDPLFFLGELALTCSGKGVVTDLTWQGDKTTVLKARVVLASEYQAESSRKEILSALSDGFSDFRVRGRGDPKDSTAVLFTWKSKT